MSDGRTLGLPHLLLNPKSPALVRLNYQDGGNACVLLDLVRYVDHLGGLSETRGLLNPSLG